MKIDTPARRAVREALAALPLRSLLRIEYDPSEGPCPDALTAAKVLNGDPCAYVVELLSVEENVRGEPYFRGKVLNQGGACRVFNPFRGTLTKLELLRVGPARA